MNDRERACELLALANLNDFSDWNDLTNIVTRNQYSGVFTTPEWTALRDWLDAENLRALAMDKARKLLAGG